VATPDDPPSAGPGPAFATVRRFEAAGFRAWPAASVHYDGTWAIRLTAGHPAKRLNSVNPLDPADCADMPARIARAAKRFEAYGRPLTFRLSPLSGSPLSRHLDGEGWTSFEHSLVMRLNLAEADLAGALDQIPLKDVARFIGAALAIEAVNPAQRPGLSEIIDAIQAEAGLFVLERGGRPVATAVCVQDGELAGLFEVVTDRAERGKGFGRRLVASALKWARLRGARQAWLQVGADNGPARGLYASLGFSEIYGYHYRRPPGA
jgi:GNAT superfamily N-acetyltransferase